MTFLGKHDWQPLVSAHISRSSKPLIVVLGPTASGKTDFSLDVAQHINKGCHGEERSVSNHDLHSLNILRDVAGAPPQDDTTGCVEVINADSRQLYRFMNVGTAKITEEEKRAVPHHLIDVVDPHEEVNIAWYKDRATEIIDDCHKRGVIPLLVGGSMLYISAVVDGLDPLPVAPPELREKIENEYDADDGWTLYDRLMSVDPETAKAFDKQNKRYVVRAMELFEMTGHPPSTLKKTVPPPYDILQFGMHWPRETLVKRIDERTKKLLQSGWIEEVESLMDRGFVSTDPGMKSVGYKEIMQWLSSEDRNVELLTEVIAAKTRQYAKRQMTWWNNDDRIRWVNAQEL